MSSALPLTGLSYQYNFSLNQNINSPYISIQVKAKFFSTKVGLRYEQTNNRFSNAQISSYGNLMPTLLFQKAFSGSRNITFSYRQRLLRPSVNYLSPILDMAEPRYKSIGNPSLVAVISHVFELGYSSFKKGFVNATLGYSYSNNGVQNVFTTGSDSSIISTFENIGKKNTISLNTSVNYPISKTLSVTLNGTLNYLILEGNVNALAFKQSGVQGFIYSYISKRMKNSWRTSVNFGFSGAPILLQGYANGFFYNNFTISKDLFQSKLNINLAIANPFRKVRVVDTDLSTSTFQYTKHSENYFQNINLSAFYSFGKLKTQIKKNRKPISNDDKLII